MRSKNMRHLEFGTPRVLPKMWDMLSPLGGEGIRVLVAKVRSEDRGGVADEL